MTLRQVRHVLGQNPLTLFAGLLALLLAFLGAFGPALAPYDPLATDVRSALLPPSARHWFGTDQLGRDLFSRIIVATRLDLAIAVSAVAASFSLGSFVGGAVGYWGGRLDRVVSRFVDVLMAFPLFVVAMALVAALGNSVENVVAATALINLPFYIRLARAEVNQRRGAGYVHAARLAGNGDLRILAHFLLPNVMPTLVVQMSLNLGWAILNTAGLSFLGLGVRPPTPEWGIMVAEGAAHIISGKWWPALFPGAALVLAVFCFNLLGDGLRDLVDPRRRT